MRKDFEHWRLPGEEVLSLLDTSATGLDDEEARRRLAEHGPNEISPPEERTSAKMLLSQFKNPLVYVLIFAAGVASLLGEGTEATIIVAIVLVNAALGFAQEYRSERAVRELRKYLSYQVRVTRAGKTRVVDSKELVPGDIVSVAIGDIVPADLRLLEVDELATNESVLTGESTPVEKSSDPISLERPLPHQLANTAFMGSEVTEGSGRGVVVATGASTYFGKIAKSLALLPPKTDFQKNIASFGNFLVRVILLLTLFVFIVNSVLGHGVFESLLFSVALAVGIIPEALPVIITVGLSDGALRLVKKKVVVKRLEAIEDIGNVDVLCTDKTGTLTQNEMTVEAVLDPDGNAKPDLIVYALLCNSAIVEGDRILGNPIDVAIWKYARSIGFDEADLENYKKVHEIPFGFGRRRMSFVFEKDGRRILVTKGAPESIMSVSSTVASDSVVRPIGLARAGLEGWGRHRAQGRRREARLLRIIGGFGQTGRRVIAIGYRDVEEKRDYSADDERDLTLVALVVLSDPPKEDAAEAISRLKALGIRLKILSGDDPLVTADVCRRLGVTGAGRVLTGTDIESMSEGDLLKAVEETDVFGRVTPEQKFAIVEALKKNGHVVGFLGDGVNDAPALRLADAGISVDSGVQVAKEASSIILLEKSLNVIADGVVEGRKAFGNMIKYIMNTISANFGNMFTVALGSIFLPFIPLLPSQILLTNLLSDAPMLTISTDNLDEEGLRKPRKWSTGSIARFMVFFGLISSVFDMVTIASLIYLLHAGQELFRTGWFIESVLSEITVTFSIRTRRRFYRSRPSRLMIIAAAAAFILTLAIVYSPAGALFEFVKLPQWFLGLVFAILASYFVLVEISKHVFFGRYEV